MKIKLFASFVTAALLLTACGDMSQEDPKTFATNETPAAYTLFDSVKGDIPYPNNILFAGSQDGTLNIPYEANASDASVKEALNSLDGFSTTSPITLSLSSSDIDTTTLAKGVHLYEANATASAQTLGIPMVSGIVKELTFGVDYVATMSGNKLAILPRKPLKSHTDYVVALTNKITNNQGNPLAADATTLLLNSETSLVTAQGKSSVAGLDDADAAKLELLRQLNRATFENVAVQKDINKSDIVITWNFQTQSIGKVAHALMQAAANYSPKLILQDTNLTSNQILEVANDGNASIFAGDLVGIPYYLGIPSEQNPYAPLTEYFDVNKTTNLPKLEGNITIPVLAALPKNSACKKPYPVVIFQHGVTVDRTLMLPLAETITRTCHAVVAIDLPLHGVVDVTNLFYQKEHERHFNLLDMDQDGDADYDDTLLRYVNLTSLRTTRDNIRQSSSDFVALVEALKASPDFNGSNISFVGHSLGTIAAIPFLSEANLTDVTLAMPGAGIAELFSNSKRYGPVVRKLLKAKAGIEPDSAEYKSFLLATQTMIDDADPINYALAAGKKQKLHTLTFEVVGSDVNPSDLVIPNSVATAPLAGTEPFLRLYDANKSVKLLAAEHSSFLTPAPVNDDNSGISPLELNASFYQIQSILGTFIYSNGTQIGQLNAGLAKE